MPTLHRVIPAIESLCVKWEKKLADNRYTIFHAALEEGLAKINKYYERMNNSNVYILALCEFTCQSVKSVSYWIILVLHPYYKLDYFALKWGGREEQLQEIKAGNPNAINWRDFAQEVVEETVRTFTCYVNHR